MTTIPFYKPSLGAEEIEEVVATLKTGWLTTGPKTKQFESEFGAYLGHKHSVAVNSCTAALHLALEAIGLKSDDSVIVPTMTFAATAEVVRYFGAAPLLVDCRPQDFNLDVQDARARIEVALAQGKSVAAVMPVHYGGQIGDVAGIQQLARNYGLKVIEDAAHCCPAFYQTPECSAPEQAEEANPRRRDSDSVAPLAGLDAKWQRVGAGADISCYSFYANKTITTGEGGMACTNNDAYAERMRVMSLHGISKDAWKRFTSEGSWYYEIIAPGYKYNLTDIAAAIGIHQLRKADAMHRSRVKAASLYSELLGDVEELILPQQLPARIHSWHLYVIRLRLNLLTIDRATFIAELKRRGVTTSVHWMPLHMHPYYRDAYGYTAEAFPTASSLYPEIVTLPLYPDLTEEQLRYVAENVKQIIAQNLRTPNITAARKTSLAGESAK